MVRYGAICVIQCSGPRDTAPITHRWRSLSDIELVLIIGIASLVCLGHKPQDDKGIHIK
jgi:hypothetical protein